MILKSLAVVLPLLFQASVLQAQDLGPHFTKIKEGIFVRAEKPADSNAAIVLTEEGVVLIDSGHNPPDSQALLKAVKQLTQQPIRYLINTEPHSDHTTGHFLFSPPATIVAAHGATDSMKKAYNPERNQRLIAEYPAMKDAFQGFRMITPHVEYKDKMVLRVGGRTFELYYLKNVHSDHTTGHFLFSPPATIVAAQGATDSMKKAYNPERNQRLIAEYPAMKDAFQGFRMITPHVEYKDKMVLRVGGRTFELYYLKNVHSEADTAIWLPQERVLFAAAAVGVKRFSNIRPFVQIPDTLNAIKMMKALNPEFVVPGHGAPGTVKILDDMERYYNQLLDRVRQMAQQGRSLDQIKQELKMPEYDDWQGKDRFPNNIEAAYRAVKGN